MEEIFKIVVSVVGLLLYWWLTSSLNKKKNAAPKPGEATPEAPVPQKRTSHWEVDEDEMQPQADIGPSRQSPSTPANPFEELLRQFSQDQPKNKPASTTSSQALTTEKPKLRSWQIEDEDDAKHPIFGQEALTKVPRSLKKPNRYAKMLQNSKSVRDAVILKEILDTKYF